MLKEEDDSPVDYFNITVDKKKEKRSELKLKFEEGSDFKFYSWDFRENYTYITYLKNFKSVLASPESRKRIKVFSHISKLIKTRNPFQIKSHHQKMMLRHKNIDAIIDYLKLKILKYLKGYPRGITEIEAINRECEAFFIQESDIVNDRKRKKNDLKPDPELAHRFTKNIIIQTELSGQNCEEAD